MDLPSINYSQNHTSIEWSITAIRTRAEDGRDIIVQLSWAMLGTRLDSTDRPVSASRNGTLLLDYNADKFINFSELTHNKLVNWVNVHLGVKKITELRNEINIELDSHLLTEQAIPA
jgi:hypothetical protein